MSTLGPVTISDNMYLGGVTQSKNVASQTVRTVEGISISRVTPTPGGRRLSLETSHTGLGIQGIWCQSVIDEIKALELLNATVVLDHNGTTYNVKIIDTTDFTQLFSFEEVGPDKKYTGKILMIEV